MGGFETKFDLGTIAGLEAKFEFNWTPLDSAELWMFGDAKFADCL